MSPAALKNGIFVEAMARVMILTRTILLSLQISVVSVALQGPDIKKHPKGLPIAMMMHLVTLLPVDLICWDKFTLNQLLKWLWTNAFNIDTG